MLDDELDGDGIVSATMVECYQAVRAANPRDLGEARQFARTELLARGVAAPTEWMVGNVARFEIVKHPVSFLLRGWARNHWEAAKILKGASLPSWTYPPKSAIDFDSDVDGEIFVYPRVDLDAAMPIFERLFAELCDSEDRFDAVGTIHNRSFLAWLSHDRSADHQILVHIAKTTIGYLDDADVELMRRSPDHLVPDEGEAIALHAMLIGTTASQSRLALWIPFPADLKRAS
jgi:hypothetical protein